MFVGVPMKIHDEIADMVGRAAGTWTVSARHLRTDELVALGEHEWMNPASAVKLALLVMCADLVDRQELDPHATVEIGPQCAVEGTGVLRFMAGARLTVADLATLMVIVSDNVATNLVLERLGGAKEVSTWLSSRHLDGIEVTGPIDFTSDVGFARATAAGLRQVAETLRGDSTVLAPAASDWAKERLFRQQTAHFLSRRVPHNAHAWDFGIEMPVRAFTKYGAIPGVAADVGLFEMTWAPEGGVWAVAVIGNGTEDLSSGPDDPGPALIADIGELLFDRWGH